MELPRIQYVTHPDEHFGELSWVHRLHDNGIRWIQLRLKEEDVLRRFPDIHYLAYFHETADQLRAITSALGMLLTINDMPEVAVFSHADGLHIGQEDEDPELVARQLPAGSILGGTANSIGELSRYKGVPMTYFGVGPLRETPTKTKLKPVLGISGYRQLVADMQAEQLDVPVFAIGGVVPSDVAPLLEAGVYGIALSGAIFYERHSAEAIRAFTSETEYYEPANRR
jgi:thiamine-phosphate pyrophosphorylase